MRDASHGHFWQGRFGSVVIDEAHLAMALRYVSLNPVRVRLSEAAPGLPVPFHSTWESA